jgi:RimJ/RimL family protein N-acetyltransferase
MTQSSGEQGGVLCTERLLLRPPGPDDLDGYLRLFLRREVGEWLRPEPLEPFDAAEIGGMLAADERHWSEHGFGLWAALDRDSGALVGRVGVRWTTVEAAPAVELAWTIDPDRHGEGLAGEAGAAGIAFGRERGIEELVAMTLPHNRASRRVAEKLGMEPAGDIVHAGLPHVLYRIALA